LEGPLGSAEKGVVVRNVEKAYAGVPVLKGISIEMRPGRIHALLGGNGAGKSTLMKVIAGLVRPDKGEVHINGRHLSPSSVKLGHHLGLYLVPQEANVFSNLSVLENITLGVPGSTTALRVKVAMGMEQLGVLLDLEQLAGTLEIADRQIVEILRGLVRDASFLILDEPTSALTPREAGALFKSMRMLAATGVGMIFISHKLKEVREICDVFDVLRDGALVLSGTLASITDEVLIEAMTNSQIRSPVVRDGRNTAADGPVVLSVDNLSGEGFLDVSLALRAGEIVGLAGVVGAGRTELAETIVGIRPTLSGSVMLNGTALIRTTPREAADLGLVYLPEDRQQNGLFLEASLVWNMSAGVMHRYPFLLPKSPEVATARAFIETLGIKGAAAGRQMAGRLSGGNQQKVLIAKCLALKPRVLITDEPTRGVDVSARADIYEILQRLADTGTAVLVISSDFEEIELLAQRVLVMTRGSFSGSLVGQDVSVRQIAQLAFSSAEH
jgi:AI-2 transport system ATP-binding protein